MKALLLTILMLGVLPAQAAIFMCQDGDGWRTYQNQPCKAGQTGRRVIADPTPAELRAQELQRRLDAAEIRAESRTAREAAPVQSTGIPTTDIASSGTSLAIPVQSDMQSPRVITECDAGTCRDNAGDRYQRKSGSNYLGPTGACRLTNGSMECP